jgi:Na+/H+-dicarboxylate symporter
MCAQHPPSFFRICAPFLYIGATLLGIFAGFSDIAFLGQLGTVLSDLFIKLFKLISMPLIALSLIVVLSSYRPESSMKNIWQRTLFYTLSTTIIAAIVACLLYLWITPDNIYNDSLIENTITPSLSSTQSYWGYLVNLLPSNIFSPFLEHQLIGVLLLALSMGTAIRFIPDDKARETLTSFFKGFHGIFLVLTGWIVTILPLGLFGFMTTMVLQYKAGMNIEELSGYLAVVVLANLVQGFIILPLWLWKNGIPPFTAMRKVLPALSLAFFSKSSTGTLPITMEVAEKGLGVSSPIARFILPLCTTINMNGCAAFIFTTVIYVMQNHGVPITASTLALWIVIATIAAIGNAGVPMGCFFLSASLLSGMNMPLGLLAIILPFYTLIDMIETALNVWSDLCVTTVVDKKVKSATIQPSKG